MGNGSNRLQCDLSAACVDKCGLGDPRDYGRACYSEPAIGIFIGTRSAASASSPTSRDAAHRSLRKQAARGKLREDHAMALLPISRSQSHDRQARLQPVDGAACGIVHSSVHRPGLRLQRFQPADDQTDRHHPIGAGRLEADRTRLDFLYRDLLSRRLGSRVWPLGRGRRSAPSDVHRRLLLRRRLPGFGARRLSAQSVDHLSRLRRAGRLSVSASATSRRSRR